MGQRRPAYFELMTSINAGETLHTYLVSPSSTARG